MGLRVSVMLPSSKGTLDNGVKLHTKSDESEAPQKSPQQSQGPRVGHYSLLIEFTFPDNKPLLNKQRYP